MENSPEKSVGKEIIPSETGKIGSENDESNVALYPELEKVASIAANATAATQPPSYSQPAQACVYQQTTVSYSRNGHSRNPSAINGITIATQVIQPATLNSKPDAKATLLKFIPFRGDFNDNNDDKRRLCGNREIRCIFLTILIAVFLASGVAFVVMWFTDLYNDKIISQLVLAPNSTAYDLFIKPPINPQLHIHIFNYTNAQRYLDGLDDKLKVEDVGPYIYTEKTQKVDVVYNDNKTISYREHRSFEFQPNISVGPQFDSVNVPNIPLMTAAWRLDSASLLQRTMISGALFTYYSNAFLKMPAYSFLWGYEDHLINLQKQTSDLAFDKFGMLVTRNGTSIESFTINSGVDDIRKLNVIDNFNGKPRMNFWSTEKCNQVDGTDGTQFPPHLIEKKQEVEVFIKAFCRKFPMVYDSEVSVFNGVPAWRYKAPTNVFDSPDKNPENECYCDVSSGSCPPSGIFNATLCFDAPIFSSFPHFLYGDESLFENIEGLSPDPEKHMTYADVHPRLGFPLGGSSRFQINVQVTPATSRLGRFKRGQLLPILWMEMTSGEVPEGIRAFIYHSTFSTNAIQLALRYGSLMGLIVSVIMLITGFYLRKVENEAQTNFHTTDTLTIEELVTIDLNDTARNEVAA